MFSAHTITKASIPRPQLCSHFSARGITRSPEHACLSPKDARVQSACEHQGTMPKPQQHWHSNCISSAEHSCPDHNRFRAPSAYGKESIHPQPRAVFVFQVHMVTRGAKVFFFIGVAHSAVACLGVALSPWSSGPWSSGPLVLWSPGPLVPWSSGSLVLWFPGPGPLLSWSAGLCFAALGRLRIPHEVGKKQHLELLKS